MLFFYTERISKITYFVKQSFFLLKVGVPIFFLILLVSTTAKALEINGTVVNVSRILLPTVPVIDYEPTIRTTTYFYGSFKLQVAQGANIVSFSPISYIGQGFDVDGRTEIDVRHGEEVQAFAEVVIKGYSAQQKWDLVSSIVAVEIRSFNKQTTKIVKSVFRTGDFTAYHNVVLVSSTGDVLIGKNRKDIKYI